MIRASGRDAYAEYNAFGVMRMAQELDIIDLAPVFAGVVYSPGERGWELYPEDRLFAGLTGTEVDRTIVRSVLSFDLPERDNDLILLRAFLRLRIVRNEPPGAPKLVCLRETPHGPTVPWTIDEELRQTVPAEHLLSSEIDLDLDFKMTPLVEAWLRGAPNNGVLLDFGSPRLGLIGFGNSRIGDSAPLLRIISARPAPGRAAVSLEIEPHASRHTRIFKENELVVKNNGPGLVWVTPLYSLGKGDLRDPAGIPLGVIENGEYMILESQLPACGMAARVTTALTKAVVVVVPLAPQPER